jgi:hypothetical protein
MKNTAKAAPKSAAPTANELILRIEARLAVLAVEDSTAAVRADAIRAAAMVRQQERRALLARLAELRGQQPRAR